MRRLVLKIKQDERYFEMIEADRVRKAMKRLDARIAEADAAGAAAAAAAAATAAG